MTRAQELYFRIASDITEQTGRALHPAFLLLDAERAFPLVPSDPEVLRDMRHAVGEIAKRITQANLFAKVVAPEDALAAIRGHYAARGTPLCPPVIGALETLLAELEALK